MPHLPRSNFASRPVARDGITYNIDSIRAIPFTMALAQLREFTNAFYGTVTAFEIGSQLLGNPTQTAMALLSHYLTIPGIDVSQLTRDLLNPVASSSIYHLVSLVRLSYRDDIQSETGVSNLIEKAKTTNDNTLKEVVSLYTTVKQGVEIIALICLDLFNRKKSPLELFQVMYHTFVPFRFSLQNKETALIIRCKRMVDEYTKDANETERALLDETEREGKLSTGWILKIMNQEQLEAKTLTQEFHSTELYLLHKVQAHLMRKHRQLSERSTKAQDQKEIRAFQLQLQTLGIHIQMSILAISEALGFGG